MNEAFAELLAIVAKKHSVTAEKIYRDMELAIEDAMQSTDTEAQRMWAEMPYKREKPTHRIQIKNLLRISSLKRARLLSTSATRARIRQGASTKSDQEITGVLWR